jgi:hypothetical protein
MRVVVLVYALLVLIPLVIGVATAAGDPAGAAERLRYFRDLLWVMVLLLTIPLLVGFALLLVQLAALFGVIRVDAGAVLAEARGALRTVTGTFRFVGETVAGPIIRVWGFFSGGWAFFRQLGGLLRALRRAPTPPPSDATTPKE